MDSIDRGILRCLAENARQNASAISKQINLSVSAVIERIKKLETSGIIQKYTVSLNQKLLGNDVMAYIEVSLEHPKFYEGFTKSVQENPGIVSCSYITGDFDFLLKVMTDSSHGLELLHRQLKGIPGVCSTKTYFVLSTIKNEHTAIPSK